ncbi:unnamed protein product [Caenorhabditis auriculariae]|uniref:Uncharacterized protein n=1 Tax=Caenorhabditis auriculariae TaxID=2777116 RepID=A0A8S1HLZ4_9PELO|nr:unnamed protein product [Caenorhabditis auriculariae]
MRRTPIAATITSRPSVRSPDAFITARPSEPMSRKTDVATGHAPSPYLRRFRLPNLNTVRVIDDAATPEDEVAKVDLINSLKNDAVSQKPVQQTENSQIRKKSLEPAEKRPFYHPQRLFG